MSTNFTVNSVIYVYHSEECTCDTSGSEHTVDICHHPDGNQRDKMIMRLMLGIVFDKTPAVSEKDHKLHDYEAWSYKQHCLEKGPAYKAEREIKDIELARGAILMDFAASVKQMYPFVRAEDPKVLTLVGTPRVGSTMNP